ncbi:MAG: glycosyltransferase family 39 protein [Candidatus Binatia bacterium]
MSRIPRDLPSLAGILIAAAAAIALIGFRGDFPLSDDWSYAYSSRTLCTEGVLRFLPWTGASLVLQAGYGALLCRIFGFSFEVLRISTLTLAATGAIGFFLLLGRAGVRGAPRALATTLFALSPLYVNLSFTFMTDVPFTVAAVWAGYAYVRGFDEQRRAWLVAGAFAAASALLIRQHGIFIAAAASVAALLAGGRPWRVRWGDAFAAGALPLLTSIAFHLWLFRWHGAPGGMEMKLTEARHMDLAGLVNCAFRGLEYLGLLLAPLALAVRHDVIARRPRLAAATCTALAVLALLLWLHDGALMFYLTNVMYDFGLGASSLRDTLFLGLRPPVQVGPALGIPLTLLATMAAGVGLSAYLMGGWERRHAPIPLFLSFAAGFLFLGTLLHARYYFDRYLLVVLPFAIAAIAATTPVRVSRAAVVLTALLAWYALAGTHDYLAWNRARYAGLAALTDAGISPREIDGGMEFNAWALAADLGTAPTDAQARSGQAPTVKSWWWVIDDRFVVSFRPLPGYAVRQSLPYSRWLGGGDGRVVILERSSL